MNNDKADLVRWQTLNMATGDLGPAGSEESARALAEATSGARMLLTGQTLVGEWLPAAEFSDGVWGEPGPLSLDIPRPAVTAPKSAARARKSAKAAR